MAHQSRLQGEPSQFALWLSISIEADYRDRGVFAALRIVTAQRRSGTRLLFRVALDVAREVLADALGRKNELGGGRGVYQAYRALVRYLAREVDEAEGVQEDPGREQWEADVRAFGCHRAGAILTNRNGDEIVVVETYGLYLVSDKSGPYRYRDEKGGGRVSYRFGYICRRAGSEKTAFWSAGDMYDDDGCITHLRLVHSTSSH